MFKELSLYRVVYSVLTTQIKFGVYKAGDQLPFLEEANTRFLVSFDTLREAYLQMQQEGYITLKKKTGAVVQKKYTQEEVEENIQDFFAKRRVSLPDVASSVSPLLGKAQWLGLKIASSVQLDKIELLAHSGKYDTPQANMQILQIIYGNLGNELLMRLVWQIFMFRQAPFLSLVENFDYLDAKNNSPISNMLSFKRREDWQGLREAVENSQDQLARAIDKFYREKIHTSFKEAEIPFRWSVHKKTSQICYSLGLELLISIAKNFYPAGSKLPSLENLAKTNGISVSTVRRTISLLNRLGVVESINGYGSKVVASEKVAIVCDFANPLVQNRLLECLQSLHLLSLSCKSVAKLSLSSANEKDWNDFKQTLQGIRRQNRPDLMIYTCIKSLSELAPRRALRQIYGQLLKLLFWGYPLRRPDEEKRQKETYYSVGLDNLYKHLEESDAEAFSTQLETLIITETRFMANQLRRKGICVIDELVLL